MVVVGLYLCAAAIGMTVAASTAHATMIYTVPTGLNPGDQYRLAFVTSTIRDATSSDIGVYNTHVTNAANSNPDLLALNADWKAELQHMYPNESSPEARFSNYVLVELNGPAVQFRTKDTSGHIRDQGFFNLSRKSRPPRPGTTTQPEGPVRQGE